MLSLQGRIVAASIGIVITVVIAISIFVQHGVERSIVDSEKRHAQQVLDLILMTVENEYNSYTFYRQSLLKERQEALSHITDLALITIENLYRRAEAGEITQEQAQKIALHDLRNMRYSEGVGYIWVQNGVMPDPRMLMHPTIPALEGEPVKSQIYRDVLGGDGKPNLLARFIDSANKGGGAAFVSYEWPKPTAEGLTATQPKISHVQLFKPWDWLIGTGLYIDDIEAICQEHLQNIINAMLPSIAKIRIAESGYVYIFDESGKFLIHPDLRGTSGFVLRNPQTGTYILHDIMAATRTPEGKLTYLWAKPGKPDGPLFEKIALVHYYKPLDWYIGVSIYIDELQAPAVMLQTKIIWVSICFLIIAVVLSWWLARGISRPLSKLALAAQKIRDEGIDAADLQVSGNLEVQALGDCLQGMVSTIKDEQKQLHMMAFLVESAASPIILTDLNAVLTHANSAFLKTWGYNNQSEVVGRPVTDFWDVKDRIDMILEKIRTEGSIFEEICGIKSNGKLFEVQNSASMVNDAEGVPVAMMCSSIDISARKRAEMVVLQSERLDAIGQLASGVAHDFNNMLGGIMGAAELLRSIVKDNPKALRYSSLIIDTADNASALTSQLLTFARKQHISSSHIDLHYTLQDSISLLKRTIDRRVVIECELSAVTAMIIGDSSQLQSVFINLGINAAHSMPEGGVIRINSKTIELDAPFCNASSFDIHPGQYIELEFRDDGCGIPAEDLPKIFEPFFTTKEQGKGTGLGLAAVYGAILQHHGAITVYSEVGQGTCFRILLPLVDGTSSERKVTSEQMLSGSGRILVVDDEEVMRTTAKDILESVGYEVVLAKNGQEALGIFKESPSGFNLVILDMVMPVMNGRDCFVELKKISPDVRVILASGFSRDEDVEKMKHEGLNGFINKPYHSAALSIAVHDALNT